jgi:hypothetical protein
VTISSLPFPVTNALILGQLSNQKLLQAIYQEKDLFASDSPLQLTSGERREVLRILNGDIYHLHYVCRYILLRLDAYRSEHIASYDYQTISVEHVLPQRPSSDSKWSRMFPSKV